MTQTQPLLAHSEALKRALAPLARARSMPSVLYTSPESFAFLSALQQGKTLAEAIESAFAVHAGFDVADQLGGAFSLGLITGLSP